MRVITGLVVALGVSACSGADDLVTPRTAKPDLVDPKQVIALMPAMRSAAPLKQGAVAQGFVLREERVLQGLELRMLSYTFPDRLDGKGAIETLEAIETTATVGVNHAYRTAAQAGALDYAGALMSWPQGGCRAQGPVGMMDTAVDLSGMSKPGGRVVSQRFGAGQGGPGQHGNDVASVLLDPQRISGATLYAAAVIGDSGDGRQIAGVGNMLRALDWFARQNVRVVNVSLTGPYNKLLDRGVAKAAQGGMVIVAAVGNDGARSDPQFPAALDAVIAVTAVDAKRRIYRKAGQGSHLDIAAPGVDVAIATDGKLRFVTGTSMAVPFVTARIATDPQLYGQSADEIRARLAADAVDLGPLGTDSIFGAGLMRGPKSCAR